MSISETGENATSVIVGAAISAAKDSPDLKQAGANLAKSALIVSQTIHTALLPLAAANFGFQKARDYFENKFSSDLGAKLKKIPPEKIVEPPPSVAGPALQGLTFAHEDVDLKDLFLNLLASAMSSDSVDSTHPAYVEIIKQMNGYDARFAKALLSKPRYTIADVQIVDEDSSFEFYARNILPNVGIFSEFSLSKDSNHSLNNLQRLGLIEINFEMWATGENAYDWVKTHPKYLEAQNKFSGPSKKVDFRKGLLDVNSLGLRFGQIVSPPRESGYVMSTIKPTPPSPAQ